MISHPHLLRRSFAGGAAALLSLATMSLATSPAQAAEPAEAQLQGNASASGYVYNPDYTPCAVTGDLDPDETAPQTVVPLNGHATTQAVDVTQVVTNPDDATDTATYAMKATSTASVKHSGGAFREAHLKATASVTGTFSQGTDGGCNSDGDVDTSLVVALTVTKAGFLTLTTKATGESYNFVGLYSPDYDEGIDMSAAGARSGTETVYARPGTYFMQFGAGASVYSPDDASEPSKNSGGYAVDVVYRQSGVATTKLGGSGAPYVKTADLRSCSAGTLATSLTGKATKVASATLAVNGKKAASVKSPKKSTKVTLKKLPAAKPVTVKATLKLKNGKTVTATRTYAACTL